MSELLGTVITKNDLINILFEKLQKAENNENEIIKELIKIKTFDSDPNIEDTILEKINKTLLLQPNFYGIGINFNKLIESYLDDKKIISGRLKT